MKVNWGSDSELGQALFGWWSGLENNRGIRADLRRCQNPVQVVLTPEFQRQNRAWRSYFVGEWNYEERLAQIMGLLVHVRTNRAGLPIALQMATGRGGEPAVSELRFRRLLQRSREEFYPAMIRILRLLRGEADIHSLAESTYFWGDEVRKRWAFDYFGNLSP